MASSSTPFVPSSPGSTAKQKAILRAGIRDVRRGSGGSGTPISTLQPFIPSTSESTAKQKAILEAGIADAKARGFARNPEVIRAQARLQAINLQQVQQTKRRQTLFSKKGRQRTPFVGEAVHTRDDERGREALGQSRVVARDTIGRTEVDSLGQGVSVRETRQLSPMQTGRAGQVILQKTGAQILDEASVDVPMPNLEVVDSNMTAQVVINETQREADKSFVSSTASTLKDLAFNPQSFKAIPLFLPGGTKLITPTEFSEVIGEVGGLPGKTAGVLIPKTAFESGLLVGGVGAFSKLPAAGRIAGSGVISTIETKRALTPGLPPEQRIASGIVGTLAGTGLVFESFPFIRGAKVRLSTKVSKVKTQPEGFKAIEVTGETTRIGLILPKSPSRAGETSNIDLPSSSALIRGGFGRKPGGEKIFLGKDQQLTTSQIGLFKQDKPVKLEREFFVTPQEPFLKIGQTRISRLGLQDIFTIPKQTELGFGIPGQPQIGLLRKGAVGRKETSSQFRIGTGSELEAIKSFGEITNVKKIGATTIKGQGVDLFEFDLGGSGLSKLPKINTGSTEGVTRVSGESVLSVIGLRGTETKPSKGTPTTSSPKPATTTLATLTSSKPLSPITPRTTARGSGRSPPSRIPTMPTTTLTPPRSPPRTPPLTPRITPPISTPRFPPRTLIPPTKAPPRIRSKKFKKEKDTELFPVLVRRFGKFKVAGRGKTPGEAIAIGKQKVGTTLARTFTVPGVSPTKLPGFKTKVTKKGVLFIEPSKRALSTGTETGELQFFKKLRGSKRSRRRKKNILDF